MYKHIMLPVDGSDASLKAAREGVALAKTMKARLTAVHVVEHFHAYLDISDDALRPEAIDVVERSHDEEAKTSAAKVLSQIEKLAQDNGVECDSVVVVGDDPGEEIVENATKHQCDLIVMTAHAFGETGTHPLGSETAKVVGHSKVPVLVVH
jgi:nucleotide-binding universal stress UspA family protein